MALLPTRTDLQHSDRVTMIRAGTSAVSADVYVYTSPEGRRMLVKDIRRRPALLRWTVGRYHLRNEYRTLRRLESTGGVPKVFGMIDADALAIEYFPGAPLPPPGSGEASGPLPHLELFQELQRLIGEFHRRGIGHGDLRRKNILWNEDGKVLVIDFGTAVHRDGPFGPFQRWVYRLLCVADEHALLKMFHSYHPQALSPEEQARLEHPPWFLRVGRFLRHDVYRPVLKQKRWRQRWARLSWFFGGRRHGGSAGPK